MRRFLASLALLAGCVGAVADGELEDPGPSGVVRDAGADAAPSGDGANGEFVGTPGNGGQDAGSVCVDGSETVLAGGLRIREIAAYQTVKIPLVQGGAWVIDRVAPLVQRKKTLLRAFVDLLSGYQARTVRGVLTLNNAGTSSVLIAELQPQSSSTDARLSTTFNFEVPAELIAPATELSISLQERSCQGGTGTAADARFPQAGVQALAATAIERLEVVLVPIRLDGRVPLTSESELTNMRSALLAHYPVPDVKLSVHAALDWERPLDPALQSSWSDMLALIERTRAADAPQPHVYYFGLVQPAATLRSYCLVNCVLGLAPRNDAAVPDKQIGVGASFGDAQTYATLVHELGHAHGRGHAPCVESGKIADVDTAYPDPTGATGSWGWDSRFNALEPPTNTDVMSYCSARWMSVYTYAGLAARSLLVNRGDLRENKTLEPTLQAKLASPP